ncbi:MAG: NAD-dependent epimerase/dehydratase family protein [Myxococcota bacterium]
MSDNLSGMPVLVTGANGFVGRELVSQLVAKGAHVRALVLPDETVPPEWATTVETFRGDITHARDVREAVAGCRVVFHLVALVGDEITQPMHARVTVGGTRHLCDAMPRGSRLLLASSLVVYGDRIGREVCTEATAHGRPQGPYGQAKQAQEHIVARAAAGGMDTVVIRPGNIYGPGCKPWLYDVADMLRRNLPVLIGGGAFDAGLVYVGNVADLFVRAAEEPDTRGATLLAVDGFGTTWKRYFEDLAEILHTRSPRSMPGGLAAALAGPVEDLWRAFRLPGRPPFTREAYNVVGKPNRFDDTTTRQRLAWAPPYTYQEGLAAIAQYVRSHGLAAA